MQSEQMFGWKFKEDTSLFRGKEYGDFGSSTMLSADSMAGESHSTQADLELIHHAADSFERKNSPPSRKLKAISSQSKPRAVRKSVSPREGLSENGDESKGTARRRERRTQKDQTERPDAATAAKAKASRERQRRERLNDSFADLTMVFDPERSLKVEKTIIIADTIKVINQIRSENGQLHHDKHQLEEYLANSEREKRELMFQHELVKRELESVCLATYGVPPQSLSTSPHHLHHHLQVPQGQASAGLAGGHNNAQRLPEQAAQPQPASHLGGLSQLMQGQSLDNRLHSAPAYTPKYKPMSAPQHSPSLGYRHNSHEHQQAYNTAPSQPQGPHPGEVSSSDPFGLASPNADFVDLDMAMNEALADLGKGSFDVAQMSMSPIVWLGASAGDDILEDDPPQQL